jgi:hypothetical protein
MREADRRAENATWPRLGTQRHAMQRNSGYRAISVEGDRELEKHKQLNARLNLPRQPQIQSAAAEIVKDCMLFEWQIVDVDTSYHGRKGCLDPWRGPALLAGVLE